MSRYGTFSRHIIMTTETATHMSGWVLRTFLIRDTLEISDSFQAGILLSAVQSFQKSRYPHAGTSSKKFHSENYVLTGKVT